MEKVKTDNWKTLLSELYDEPDSTLAINGVRELLEKNRSGLSNRRAGDADFSQRDVILITYPDQVVERGVPPLRVLSDFCKRHLDGWIPFLHILPFFPSSSDDGFAVTDYRHVDPSLGTWEDITRLRGNFRLMVDAVVNHVSARSAWFQSYLRGGKKYRGYFIEVTGTPDLSEVVRPRSTPLLHRYGSTPKEKTIWTTFSDDQVDLNYRNPRVLLEIADLLLFYASRGAGIIRLDAVAYLWKEMGTPCINLPQTHRIVRLFRSLLEEVAPDVKLVTETNIPHAENIAYFGDGTDEAHLVYNFALPPLILHTFQTGDSGALSQWAGGLCLPSGRAAFLNFLASHDGIGLNAVRNILPEADIDRMVQKAFACGGRISFKRNPDGSTQPYELNINYFDALSDPSDGDSLELPARRFLSAHAILLSLAGVPAIYFHSLFGSRGWPQGVERTGKNRAVNRQKIARADIERELADESSLRSRIFRGMSRLIRIREKHPAFHPQAVQRTLACANGVFGLQRISPETGAAMLCLHNVTGRDQDIRTDSGEVREALNPSGSFVDVITGRRCEPRSGNPIPLKPYQVCWFASDEQTLNPETERNLPA
jgi:glycosidase